MSQLRSRATIATIFNRIIRYLAGFNYSYGLRMVLGIALAWFIAFRLQTDKPYWSIMTVIIVTLPTQSMLVEKFLARLVGTMIGIIVVNVIAALALSDPWLFTIYMAFWLAFCSYLASARSPILTYCFALCGYTSAIIGFALSISPTSYMVFQISQARILEIYIGLVTAFFISMLWPAYLERLELKQKLREKRTKARKIYQALLTVDYDKTLFYRDYQEILIGLMDFRDLVFYDFFSASTNAEKNISIYRYGHRLMRAVSGILMIDMLKRDLLQTDRDAMVEYLQALKTWFTAVGSQEEKLADRPCAPKALLQSDKGRHFVSRLETKFDDIFSVNLKEEIKQVSKESSNDHVEVSKDSKTISTAKEKSVWQREKLYIPSLRIYYSDRKEALINACRTFVSIIIGMAFWMGTQWDSGYILLILIGIICTLGATYPMITKLLSIALGLTMVFSIPLIFIIKFGLLIQVNSLEAAMLIVLPIYFIAALLQVRSVIGFLIGFGFLLGSPFMIGFANPMNFELEIFANQAFTMIVALIIVLLMFNIIRPSTNDLKVSRIRVNAFSRFKALMKPSLVTVASQKVEIDAEKVGENRRETARERRIYLADKVSIKAIKNYEAYLYSAIHQIKLLPETREKSAFVAYAFLTLAMLRGQLAFKENGQWWDLPESLIAAIENDALEDALQIVIEKEQSSESLARQAYWELRCALISLKEFLATIE